MLTSTFFILFLSFLHYLFYLPIFATMDDYNFLDKISQVSKIKMKMYK